jgi:hypothetical protein
MPSSGDRVYLVIEYRRIKGGRGRAGVDYIANGLRYTVEVSADAVNWESGVDKVALAFVISGGSGNTETVGIRMVEPLVVGEGGEPTQFMRLRVTRGNP